MHTMENNCIPRLPCYLFFGVFSDFHNCIHPPCSKRKLLHVGKKIPQQHKLGLKKDNSWKSFM